MFVPAASFSRISSWRMALSTLATGHVNQARESLHGLARRDALSKTNDKVSRRRLSTVGRCMCCSLLVRVGRPPLPEMFLPRAAHSRTHGAAPPNPARLRQTPWAAPQSGPLEAGLPIPASLETASPID